MASVKKTDDIPNTRTKTTNGMTNTITKSTDVNNNVTSSSCSIEKSSNSEHNANPSITTSNALSSDLNSINSNNTVKTQKTISKNDVLNNMTNRTEKTQTEPQHINQSENDKQSCSQSSIKVASQTDNQSITQRDNQSSSQTEKPTNSNAGSQTDRQTINQTANQTIRQEHNATVNQTNRQLGSRNNRYNQRQSEPPLNRDRSYVSFRGHGRYPQHRNNNFNNQNINNRNNNNHNNSRNSSVNSVSRNSNNNNSRRGRHNSNVSNNNNIQNNNSTSNNNNSSTSNNTRPATLSTSSLTNEVSSSIPLSSCLPTTQPTNVSTSQTQTTISTPTNTCTHSLPTTTNSSNSTTTTLSNINANANSSIATSTVMNSNNENRNSQESHILDVYEFIFDPEPAGHFMCPVCLQVLREAHQTKCGHRFCKKCLKSVESRNIGRGFKCPIDKTQLRWNASSTKDVQIFPDLAIDREITSLMVKCHNHTKGCRWKGELSNHSAHIQICTGDKSFCEYGCGLSFKREDIFSHISKCPNRKVKCAYCHQEMHHNFLTRHQLLECSKLPMRCIACGRVGLTREDAPTHLDPHSGDCPSIVATCLYAPLGCSFTSQRGSIQQHYHDCMEYHNSLSIDRVLANTNRLDDLVHTVCNCINFSQRLEGTIAFTRNFCQQNWRSINSTLPRVRDLETLGHDGKLFWKVKIPYTTHEATYPVNSPHFFLGSPGYRFILTIFYPGKNFEIPFSNSAGEGSDNSSNEDSDTLSRNQCIKACLQLKPNRFCNHPLMFPIDGRLQIVVYRPHSRQNVADQDQTEKLKEKVEKVEESDVSDNIDTNPSFKKDHFSIERVFKGLVPCSTNPSQKPYPVLVDLMTRQQLKDGGFEENNAFHVFVKVSLD